VKRKPARIKYTLEHIKTDIREICTEGGMS
jgi:hypothetical protein